MWSANFEKFTSYKQRPRPAGVESLEDCDWSHFKYIVVNFIKLTDNNKILSNDFAAIITSSKLQLKLLSGKKYQLRFHIHKRVLLNLLWSHHWSRHAVIPFVQSCSHTTGPVLQSYHWSSLAVIPLVHSCSHITGPALQSYHWSSHVVIPLVQSCSQTTGLVMQSYHWSSHVVVPGKFPQGCSKQF